MERIQFKEDLYRYQVVRRMPIYNFGMLTIACIKLMFYLRMFENFGNLITLVYTCVVDMLSFLIFMFFFFIFFTFIFEYLGT